MRTVLVGLCIVLVFGLSLPAAAQAPDEPRFMIGEGILYGNAGSGWVPAELSAVIVQQSAELPSGESFLLAQVQAEIDGGSYPVSSLIGVPLVGGDYTLPTVVARQVDEDGILTIEVDTPDDVMLTFTEGALSAFEVMGEAAPTITVMPPNPRTFDDAGGLFAKIEGVLVKLPVEGFGYLPVQPIDDEGRGIFTTQFFDADNYFIRTDRLYLVDQTTLDVTLLVEDTIVLEGDFRLLPDGETLLYTAYSDETGAAVWRVGIDGETKPEMVVNRLPFYADAGNFALPQFADVTDETFSVLVVIIDFEAADGPVDRSEIRTYTLAGDLIGSAPRPTPTPEHNE